MNELVEPARLKELLDEVLSKSDAYKHIEGINPCRISFNKIEYYIYIKNITSSAFPNGNADITRIQLPRKELFDSIKESNIPFILLGYDAENDVFSTWDPSFIKERLNITENVSCYSRMSSQISANITSHLIILKLSNGSNVIIFPRKLITLYLKNINTYFPNIGINNNSDTVENRNETNNKAFKELIDTKNIVGYTKFLESFEFSKKDVYEYRRAIRTFIYDNYFKRNKELFTKYNSVIEYRKAIDPFLKTKELIKLNKKRPINYSVALEKYVSFLIYNENTENIIDVEKEKSNSVFSKISDKIFDYFVDKNNIKEYLPYLQNRKIGLKKTIKYITIIIQLLLHINNNKSAEYLNIFRKCSKLQNYNTVLSEFVNRPEILELQLGEKYDILNDLVFYIRFLLEGDYYKELISKAEEYSSNTNSNNIDAVEVIAPTYNNEDADWDDKFIDSKGKLTRITNSKLINLLSPCLNTEYKSISKAYQIIENFYGDRFKEMEMSDWKNLFDQINWNDPYYIPFRSDIETRKK